MGLSASQARLLTITARLTANEFESQQVSTAKMRLANQTQEASADYIAALSSTKLMYSSYDAKGDATKIQLTANTLLDYSELKNQYALVNSQGQILLSNTDAQNFEKSEDLDQFLSCYGIEKNWKSDSIEKNLETIKKEGNEAQEAWMNLVREYQNRNDFKIVTPEKGEYTNVSAYETYLYDKETALNNYAYYQNVFASYNDDLDKIDQKVPFDLDIGQKAYIEYFEVPNGPVSVNNEHYNYVKYSNLGEKNVGGEPETDANGKPKKDENGNIIYKTQPDKYAHLQAIIDKCSDDGNDAVNYINEDGELKSVTMANQYEAVRKNLALMYKAHVDMQMAFEEYTDVSSFDSWAAQALMTKNDDNTDEEVNNNIELYKKYLEKYVKPTTEIDHELEESGFNSIEETYTYNDDVKARWYTNLWYRLNADDTTVKSSLKGKQNYAVIDNSLADSPSWLKDALTQGIITIEVASYEDTANVTLEKNELPNPSIQKLRGISWTSKIYSNITELSEQDDDAAVAKAQAEYEKKTAEISAKDEKYQNKIKNLDTEHSALQTEYNGIQEQLKKNVDRSFKIFS